MQTVNPLWTAVTASSALAGETSVTAQETARTVSVEAMDHFTLARTSTEELTRTTQPQSSLSSLSSAATPFIFSAVAGLGLFGCSGSANQQGAQTMTGVEHGWQPPSYIPYLAVSMLLIAVIGVYFRARRLGLTRELDPFIDAIVFGLQRRLGMRNGFEFYTDVNEMFRNKKLEPSHERADQYLRLRDLFHSRLRKIPIVTGEVGSGKSHFLMGIAHEILNGYVPEFPKGGTSIFRFSLSALPTHKDLTYFGYTITEWRIFSKRVDTLLRKGQHVLILMDGIDRFVTSGAVDGTANDLLGSIYYKLLRWRENPRAVVIGAARSDIFQSQIQSTDMARYVQRFDLPLLTTDQVAKIVDKRAGRWAQENVQISYEARKRALELSQHPDVQKHFKNPEAALRILDVAYARAMRLASDKDETSNIFQRDHAGKKVWVASPEMAEAAAAEMFHIPLDSLKIWNLNPPPAPPAPLPPPPPPVRSLPIPPPAVPRPMVVRPSTPPPSRASKSAPPAAPARRRKRS